MNRAAEWTNAVKSRFAVHLQPAPILSAENLWRAKSPPLWRSLSREQSSSFLVYDVSRIGQPQRLRDPFLHLAAPPPIPALTYVHVSTHEGDEQPGRSSHAAATKHRPRRRSARLLPHLRSTESIPKIMGKFPGKHEPFPIPRIRL